MDLACQLLLHAVLPYAMDENVVSAIYSTPTSSVPGPGVGSLKEKLLQLEKFSLESANFQVHLLYKLDKFQKPSHLSYLFFSTCII